MIDSSCEFKFRGYHGLYDVEVIFPDGQLISNEIKLNPKRKPLLVEINTHGMYYELLFPFYGGLCYIQSHTV